MMVAMSSSAANTNSYHLHRARTVTIRVYNVTALLICTVSVLMWMMVDFCDLDCETIRYVGVILHALHAVKGTTTLPAHLHSIHSMLRY